MGDRSLFFLKKMGGLVKKKKIYSQFFFLDLGETMAQPVLVQVYLYSHQSNLLQYQSISSSQPIAKHNKGDSY
jgi:hypothetical protein